MRTKSLQYNRSNTFTTMDKLTEERFRKIENEELLKIFPINTVISTQKIEKGLVFC